MRDQGQKIIFRTSSAFGVLAGRALCLGGLICRLPGEQELAFVLAPIGGIKNRNPDQAFNVSRVIGHARSTIVDPIYAHTVDSGLAGNQPERYRPRWTDGVGGPAPPEAALDRGQTARRRSKSAGH
jgi:hypothetical protein